MPKPVANSLLRMGLNFICSYYWPLGSLTSFHIPLKACIVSVHHVLTNPVFMYCISRFITLMLQDQGAYRNRRRQMSLDSRTAKETQVRLFDGHKRDRSSVAWLLPHSPCPTCSTMSCVYIVFRFGSHLPSHVLPHIRALLS